jgi:inosine-uridine nucleoside N-ribohydrolase
LQTISLLIQSKAVEVLGITIVSGNQWRDEEVAHTLRFLEIIGRTDIPVFKGAAFPLVRTREEAQLWQERYGKTSYAGAWDGRWWHEPFVLPIPDSRGPANHQAEEGAVQFLIRMVHKYSRENVCSLDERARSLSGFAQLDDELLNFPPLALGLRG